MPPSCTWVQSRLVRVNTTNPCFSDISGRDMEMEFIQQASGSAPGVSQDDSERGW